MPSRVCRLQLCLLGDFSLIWMRLELYRCCCKCLVIMLGESPMVLLLIHYLRKGWTGLLTWLLSLISLLLLLCASLWYNSLIPSTPFLCLGLLYAFASSLIYLHGYQLKKNLYSTRTKMPHDFIWCMNKWLHMFCGHVSI